MIFHDEPQGAEPAREITALGEPLAGWDDVYDSYDANDWKTGVSFFLDDTGSGYAEPTDRWYAVVRTRQRYGHSEMVFTISPEMEATVERFVAQAKAIGEAE